MYMSSYINVLIRMLDFCKFVILNFYQKFSEMLFKSLKNVEYIFMFLNSYALIFTCFKLSKNEGL